jgi:hypothetical protein
MESISHQTTKGRTHVIFIGHLNVRRDGVNRSRTGNSGCAIFQRAIDKIVPINTVAIDRNEEITRFHCSAVDRQTGHRYITMMASKA